LSRSSWWVGWWAQLTGWVVDPTSVMHNLWWIKFKLIRSCHGGCWGCTLLKHGRFMWGWGASVRLQKVTARRNLDSVQKPVPAAAVGLPTEPEPGQFRQLATNISPTCLSVQSLGSACGICGGHSHYTPALYFSPSVFSPLIVVSPLLDVRGVWYVRTQSCKVNLNCQGWTEASIFWSLTIQTSVLMSGKMCEFVC
jgi:hypothetical protein